MTDNDKSYEQKHSKENKDMWKANGERVAFLYKKLERLSGNEKIEQRSKRRAYR